MIHFALKFDDGDGHTAGVVFAGLDLRWLSEHLKERGLSPSASILIADREGNIIARLPNPETLVGKNMRKGHAEIMDGNTTGWEEARRRRRRNAHLRISSRRPCRLGIFF